MGDVLKRNEMLMLSWKATENKDTVFRFRVSSSLHSPMNFIFQQVLLTSFYGLFFSVS